MATNEDKKVTVTVGYLRKLQRTLNGKAGLIPSRFAENAGRMVEEMTANEMAVMVGKYARKVEILLAAVGQVDRDLDTVIASQT